MIGDTTTWGATGAGKDPCRCHGREGILFRLLCDRPDLQPFAGGLVDGCYPRRVGNEIWVHRAIHQRRFIRELTLPELLKDHGYKTAHRKMAPRVHEPFLPRNQGFDHYFGLLHNLDVETVFFRKREACP